MAGQVRAKVERKIAVRIKLQFRELFRPDCFGFFDLRHRDVRFGGVVGLWKEPRKPEDRRAVGRMTYAGKGKRSVQRRPHARHVERRFAQSVEKPRGSHHRAHRV